jgi:hypothetical protein
MLRVRTKVVDDSTYSAEFFCDDCEKIFDKWVGSYTELFEVSSAVLWVYCPYCASPLEFIPAWERTK